MIYTKGPLAVKVFASAIGDNHEYHVVSEDGQNMATFWGQYKVAEDNAALFAAAHELLESLKEIFDANCFYQKAGDERVFRLATQAIAKAEER